MPYCPKCQFEYVEGATQCPDCGVGLAEGSPVTPTRVPESPEVAYTGQTEMDVLRAQAFLDSDGIVSVVRPFAVAEAYFDGLLKHPSDAWGQLLVSREDVLRARELLSSLEPVPPEELPEAADE